MSLKNKSFLLIGLILLIDQISKLLVKTNMELGDQIHVIGQWCNIYFIENPGMAFGMLFGGPTGKIVLVLFRFILAGFLLWYIPRLIKTGAKTGLVLGLAGICAGALGNIIDCAFYGLIFDKGTVFDPALGEYVYYSGIAQLSGKGYASFMHGCVVDMFYFPVIRGTFPNWFPINSGEDFIFFRPIFNVADSAITISIFYLFLFQRKSLNKILGNKNS